MDREIPKMIFKFFRSAFILRHSNYGISNLGVLISAYKNHLLKALQLADSDIIDFTFNVVKEKGRRLRANLDTEKVSLLKRFLLKITSSKV